MQFSVHVLFVKNGDKMGKLLLKPRGKQKIYRWYYTIVR